MKYGKAGGLCSRSNAETSQSGIILPNEVFKNVSCSSGHLGAIKLPLSTLVLCKLFQRKLRNNQQINRNLDPTCTFVGIPTWEGRKQIKKNQKQNLLSQAMILQPGTAKRKCYAAGKASLCFKSSEAVTAPSVKWHTGAHAHSELSKR